MGCASSSAIDVKAAESSTHLLKVPFEHVRSPTRQITSASKDSVHSADSGFTDKTSVADGHHITEDSSQELLNQVESSFKQQQPDLDLSLTGKQCEQRLSAKDRAKKEEKSIANMLLNEGLVQKPISKVGRSVRFDIVEAPELSGQISGLDRPPLANIGSTYRPLNSTKASGFKRPARLEKLIMPNRSVNKQEIAEKLEKANARRLEIQQERISSIQKTTGLLDAFAKRKSSTISDE